MIKEEIKNFEKYIEEPKHIKILKIATTAIALTLIIFLTYNNLLASKEIIYVYDIGDSNDYLSPSDRISKKTTEENTTYINLTGHLVYFWTNIPRGTKTIEVEISFKDNFPAKSTFNIGARNNQTWSYQYNQIYEAKEKSMNEKKWLTRSTKFEKNEDSLYLEDRKLSLFLNAEHLREDLIETNSKEIPIDYIKITAHKSGLIERIKNKESFIEALKGVLS